MSVEGIDESDIYGDGELELPLTETGKIAGKISDIMDTIEVYKSAHVVSLKIKGSTMGYIHPAPIEVKGFLSLDHLAKYISKEYRGKGLGMVLMKEYIAQGFPLPPYEYSKRIDAIRLLINFGYKPIGYLKNGFF